MLGGNKIKTGTYTGTGAAIDLVFGFTPDFMLVANITDGDIVGMWFSGMTAGTGIDIAAAVAGNAAGGFTEYPGEEGVEGPGMTVGVDYSESAKVYRYVAMAAN